MKHLVAILFLFPALAFAQTNILRVSFADLGLELLADRKIELRAIQTNISGSTIISREYKKTTTDTNGEAYFTNVVAATYDLSLASTPPTLHRIGVTNSGTNVMDAAGLIGVSVDQNSVIGYTRTQSDARFYPLTSNPSNYVDASVTNGLGTGTTNAYAIGVTNTGYTLLSGSTVEEVLTSADSNLVVEAAARVAGDALKLDAASGVATGTHNFTNAIVRMGAKPTNWTATVVGSYPNLVLGTNSNTGGVGSDILFPAGSGLRWLVGGIWNFSDHDASGDELIIDGSPHIALIPGNVTDTFPGRTQLGAGGPGHDWLMVNHDNPTTSTDVGNTWSKTIGLHAYSFVDGVLRSHMPGFKGFSYRTNVVTSYPYSEGELRFYSAIPQWFGLWNQDVEPNAPGLESFRAGPYGIKINASHASTGLDISGNAFPTLTFSTNKWKLYHNLSSDWFFIEHTANGTSPLWIDEQDVMSIGVSGKPVNVIGPLQLSEGILGDGSSLTNIGTNSMSAAAHAFYAPQDLSGYVATNHTGDVAIDGNLKATTLTGTPSAVLAITGPTNRAVTVTGGPGDAQAGAHVVVTGGASIGGIAAGGDVILTPGAGSTAGRVVANGATIVVGDAAFQAGLTTTNPALHNPQLSGVVNVNGGVVTNVLQLWIGNAGNAISSSGGKIVLGTTVTTSGDISPTTFTASRTLGGTTPYFSGAFGSLTASNITVLGNGITNAGPLILGQIAEPVTGTDKAGLYAADVSGTAEVFVVDEAGNETQISPHAMNSPGIASDTNALPIILHHLNRYSGEQEWLHLSKLARAVEKLTGEQIIYSQPLPQNRRRNWQQDQNQFQAEYDARRAAALEEFNAGNTNITVPPARDIRQPEPPIARRGGGRP